MCRSINLGIGYFAYWLRLRICEEINRVNPEGAPYMIQPIPNSASELSTKIWKTRGSRLNAYRRINSRAKISLYLISIYSSYVLLASIFAEKLEALTPSFPSALNITLISLSLLILVVSIIEGTSRHEVVANNLHECAKKLTPLINRLNIIKDQPPSEATTATIKKINKKYASIINACADNHSPIDYKKFQLEHPELKVSVENKPLVIMQYHISKIIFFLAATIPLIVIISLIQLH